MKLLVTGGAGFIGFNFIRYYLERHPKDSVVCLDKLTYAGNLQNIRACLDMDGFRFVKGDISDREVVNRLFDEERFHFVVNFAAESHVDRSIENPAIFLESNVIGTQVLLDASLQYGVERYHQVSTDEVYGELPLDRPDLLFHEKTPLNASSPYSASKAAADLLTMAYFRTFRLPATVSRCSNNYGPYQFPEKLIPRMIICALSDRPLPVYGDGENVRDWLHVYDHCTAIDMVLHRGTPGEIYNIGAHNEQANIAIVKSIVANLKRGHIQFVADRPGHDRRYAVDASKIQRDLGWVPTIPFEEGLKRTICWYSENRCWWEAIRNGEYRSCYGQEFYTR